MSEFSVIGRRLPKVNAWAHLTGQARYADDLFLPRMLYGRLLRSTRPHARIKRIDVTPALAHPGVVAVLTGEDRHDARVRERGCHVNALDPRVRPGRAQQPTVEHAWEEEVVGV